MAVEEFEQTNCCAKTDRVDIHAPIQGSTMPYSRLREGIDRIKCRLISSQSKLVIFKVISSASWIRGEFPLD
jgi:hypothetical protein